MKILKFVMFMGIAFLSLNCLATSNVIVGGKSVEQERKLANFNSITSGGAFIINVNAKSKTQKVSVTADENLLPHIITKVTADTLNIYPEPNFTLESSKPIIINISANNLKSLQTSGAVKITANDVNSPDFNLETSGAARVIFSGTTTKFNLESSGASQIILSGTTKELTIHSSGFANINTKNLKAEKVAVTTSGANRITISASKSLSINSSGMSSISYYGNPQIEQSVSGMSQIKHLSE